MNTLCGPEKKLIIHLSSQSSQKCPQKAAEYGYRTLYELHQQRFRSIVKPKQIQNKAINMLSVRF